MCLDYRAFNKKNVKNKCPLPRIDEIFDRLEGAKHFTTLDLRSGYYQIRVKDDDVPKTCIRTWYGSFEFLVMPFGLTNAPSVFQALMNDVFWEFLNDFVMVYLDDITTCSKSEREHLQHVETVLQKLKKHDLYGKLWKCHFNETEVEFLGHVVNAEGIKIQKSKVEVIQKYPRPKNVRDLQSFLGLANYYRSYITNFSTPAALTNATRGQRRQLDWGKPQESAFHDVKRAYTTAPVLKIADPALNYVVTTDASDFGIGAVLEQEYDDGLHPVACASRKLNSAEQNYPTHDRELLAIIYAVCCV
jgi:RNase H-like domain found in reverse transcriptase/Reverse transcriptase (RNA-dependent DNA polymerase)